MADQTVRTTTIPWLTVVLEADPEFYSTAQDYGYPFSNGEKKKAPNEQGIYAPEEPQP